MTGHQINSLVGDLVAMAQAMERLPQVEAELAEARHVLSEMDKQIESVRSDLEQSRSYAASLEAKVHSAEVARDDAELRFLEADEQRTHTLDRLNQMGNIIRAVTNELDPPKPQPEPQPEPVSVQADPTPTTVSIPSAGSGTAYETDTISAQGQSEPDPIASEASTTGETVLSGTASMSSDASSEQPSSGPFAGRRYIDYPGYVSRMEWLAGGGTEEDYDFRY